MPMIVDPDAPLIEPPERVTSPDGFFAAVVDEPWAGVVLSVDYATPPDTAQNLALNPSVEINLDNTQTYNTGTRLRVTTDAKYGTACVQHTQTGGTFCGSTWSIPAQTAGTKIRASVWLKLPASGVTTAFFAWRNGSTTLQVTSVGSVPAGAWTRVTAEHTLTAGQTCDRVGIAVNGSVGAVWWAEGMMVETGVTAASPYVDGDQPGCEWTGAAHASTSQRVLSSYPTPLDIRKIRIIRQDPGAAEPVPVRSADTAWAIEGVGTAYDHEAPLGVAVVYTATPIYADGSEGSSSSLSVAVPAPAAPADVWIKSVDEPSLSARVVVTQWPTLTWSSRIEQAQVEGGRYPVTAQDEYSAAGSTIEIDAEPDQIELLERLLTTPGVRLIQTDPANRRPDQFVLFTDPAQTIDSDPTEGRTYTAGLLQVARPATAGHPMRMPGWSYDVLAAQFATYNAVSASYSSYAELSTNGIS